MAAQRGWAALWAIVVAAGLFALPSAPARAAAPASTSCRPGGATAADQRLADRLRPAMTGRRLGQAISGKHVSCARAIVAHVREAGLGERAAVIAVTTAIAESTLHNYTVAVDHDSLGLFQQRPSMGWGSPAQLTDSRYATRAFLRAMLRKHPAGDWLTGDIGRICQRVQGSAYPLAYSPEVPDAHLIVMALLQTTGDLPTSSVVRAKPVTPPAKKATGPFQRVLSSVKTGLGEAAAQNEIFTADWNGDRHADLVAVQRTGTATGSTEIRILDGNRDFQPLLLHTATVLGPTDARHAFSMADWNGDGRLDLVVILKSGTASGRTEVRVLDGASFFQRFLVEIVTVLDPTDDRHVLSLADWNGDKQLDLVIVQKTGTVSGKTEVRVLDGASGFRAQLMQTDSAIEATDDRHDVLMADANNDKRLDLVVVQKSGTASGKAEVRIADGASYYQRTLLRAGTAQAPTDDRHDLTVTDWNGDGRLELLVAQKAGTPDGRIEVQILGPTS